MSAVEDLTVVLEHDIDEQYQYEPGEVIRGNVRVKVVRPTAIRAVTIRVVGEGNVSWKEEEGGGVINQAEEKYIDTSKVILETPHSLPQNLAPGFQHFPFQYQLPDNLPSSYIGKFGNVTYTMKATVTGVKSIDTSITSEPFLILRRSVLPETIEEPINLAHDKRLWGACTMGKVSARLNLEKRGGLPGEDLFMHAEIKNRSQRTVTAMQASLLMLSTYQARNNSIGFSQVVSKKRDEFDVERGEGRRWNYVRLTLPPYIPETSLEHCDIIDIDYVFQFRVEISGGAEMKMEVPVLIGSHFHGQESRRNHGVAPAVNNHWSVKTRGFHLDEGHGDRQHVDLGQPHDHWGLDSRVPELQQDRVVNNPLFRQTSINARPRKEPKEVPAEQMENTRL